MADQIGLSFETDDFIYDIKRLLKIVSSETVTKALSAGAMIIETKAKLICPVDTGALKASIQAQKPVLFKKGGYVEVIVSAEYGIYVEYGTKFMGAQPYLRPGTYENVEQVNNAMSNIMGIEIDRALS